MYQFTNDAERDAFRTALANGAMQHISSVMKNKSGSIVYDYTIADSPSIDSRCIEDEDVFNIAGMYVGQLDMRIKNSNVRAVNLIGGEVSLTFSIDSGNSTISVPLGVFDIVDAKRESENFIKIVGHDHMGRLATATGVSDIGFITLEQILNRISAVASVSFAQTPAQILEMAIKDDIDPDDPLFTVFGTCARFEETCWDEVRMIAQMIGGFACANRAGQIEFRRFSHTSVLDITADKRFRIEISEQNYNVKGATYSRSNGQTYTQLNTLGPETSSIICIPHNKWIWTASNSDDCYIRIANRYASYLAFPYLRIYPGSIDFYGDPSLDLGDMVTIVGGIGGDTTMPVNFLVCCNYWQFRGAQTISAGGAPSVGQYATSSSSESGSGVSPTPAGVSKNINVCDLSCYPGSLFTASRTIGLARIGCNSDTNIFLEATLIISGTSTAVIEVDIYIDDEKETLSPKASISLDQYTTLSFSLTKQLQSGPHTIKLLAKGASELTGLIAYVWGQDITSEEPDYSDEFTYIIDVDNNKATITGYIGDNLYVMIPEQLGGATVDTIGHSSFAGLDIKAVYIPDGITTIE